MDELGRLMLLMTRLRDEQTGCPWDRRQTMKSLLPHTLEEVYELADTIARDDLDHLKEELGDYLFQAAFYAQIASEQGQFDLRDAIEALVDKLVLRHPHVFPDGQLQGRRADAASMDETQIKATWEALKQQSRRQREQHGLLDDVPLALPAMQRAEKLQKRAATVGFDWHRAEQVFDKCEEELAELRLAVDRNRPDEIADELGDLLFSWVNLARHLNCDAEQVLAAANRRFERRFATMEQLVTTAGDRLDDKSAVELDALWEQAKRLNEP